MEFKQSLASSTSFTTSRTTIFSIKEAHCLYFLMGVNYPSLQNPYPRGEGSDRAYPEMLTLSEAPIGVHCGERKYTQQKVSSVPESQGRRQSTEEQTP